jgi:N utilization substance protein A
VAHALSPARVSRVEVVDPQARAAQVIVPDYQLSLAIGKEGQNVRLAAKLTGWRIVIQPDTPGTESPAASAGPDEPATASSRGGEASDAQDPGTVPGAADAPAL